MTDVKKQPEADEFAQNKGLRLNHAIARSGYCSRRKADMCILQGIVTVNGKKADKPGTLVAPGDIIAINGNVLKESGKHLYLMLNKPIQVLCTNNDPQGRQTVYDLLPDRYRKKRLFSIGRLDYFSEGLLLLTTDGDFAQRLAHPAHGIKKIYEVLIRGSVPPGAIARMENGVLLKNGIKLLPVKIKSQNKPYGNTLLKMELGQGINRQIRRMCEETGLTILKLKRVAQGALKLGALEPGKVRELAPEEIAACQNL